MKKLMTLAVFLVWSNSHADQIDKLNHAVYSSAIYGASAIILNPSHPDEPDLLLPLVITLGLGVAKEFILDDKVDGYDILADFGGAMCAMGLISLTW